MHTEVDVENPKRLLVPGSYAEADLTLEQKNGVAAVPLQALNHEGDKTTVYVVDANGKIQDRPVALGLQTENSAEVISGLSEGEQVVVSDRSGLKSGESVRTQPVQLMQYQEGS
jgi:multidrug efflux pump subunit AcrA (membrane-fusion protein)